MICRGVRLFARHTGHLWLSVLDIKRETLTCVVSVSAGTSNCIASLKIAMLAYAARDLVAGPLRRGVLSQSELTSSALRDRAGARSTYCLTR